MSMRALKMATFVLFAFMLTAYHGQDHSETTEDFGESLKDEYTHNLIGTKHTFLLSFSNYI